MRLTHERLQRLLGYNPETGALVWLERPSAGAVKVYRGMRAGTIHSVSGYRQIQIDGRIHKAHRLAWMHYYGEWPAKSIDHINGVPDDNRIANLRLASYSQNGANSRQRRKNPRRLKGVVYHKTSGLWRAEITKDYKRTSLGYFRTEQEAHDAYVRAAKLLHGEFFSAGRDKPEGA